MVLYGTIGGELKESAAAKSKSVFAAAVGLTVCGIAALAFAASTTQSVEQIGTPVEHRVPIFDPINHQIKNKDTSEITPVELQTAKCLTVFGHTDGFGAGYSAILSGVMFAFLNKVPFRHTEVKHVAHAQNFGGVDKAAVQKETKDLDAFLGLHGTPAAAQCVDRFHFKGQVPIEKVAEVKTMLRKMYFENDKSAFEPTDFGAKYKAGDPNFQPECTASSCDVVVHIRRGDVGQPKKVTDVQFVSDSKWIETLDRIIVDLRGGAAKPPGVEIPLGIHEEKANFVNIEDGDSIEAIKAKPIRFHVYSEGVMADFDVYQKWAAANRVGVRFHLNGDLRQAFHAMVQADVLAFGPSTFPALAGKFHDGTKYWINKDHAIEKNPQFNMDAWG